MSRRKKKLNLSTATDQKDCKLLGLPAKPRSQTYKVAYEGGETKAPERSKTNHKGRIQAPGLLLACRQLYAEDVKMHYAFTSHQISNIYRLKQWMRKIGPRQGRELFDVMVSEGAGGYSLQPLPGHGGRVQKEIRRIQHPMYHLRAHQ
ncbi:hypothetical protein DOTSEDRAFT_27337 [Dothistroma septosporum NZE10]|uniref:Uncharacterized protein n=1 Tax=Dothistroma septosporum (strain NZE10 / CBS 128990) TaxID=675120 RepID=N1PGS7_DOTSN|nr:hypothetical protein DOTSEDRAFT_27337 [Dothistroma septosporum NZE10]